jgi:hypothetical protein
MAQSDLVRRLRDAAENMTGTMALHDEAADRIEQLEMMLSLEKTVSDGLVDDCEVLENQLELCKQQRNCMAEMFYEDARVVTYDPAEHDAKLAALEGGK